MKVVLPLFYLLLIISLTFVSVELLNLAGLFGVILPYAGFVIFALGLIWKIIGWACSPVPFCIPLTSGQQRSFPWVKANKLGNPSNILEVLGRMALEILLFRSLFRNTKAELKNDHLAQGSTIFL
jgi:hypothetical protein